MPASVDGRSRSTRPAAFASDCSGATAIEYGLIASLIVIVIIVALNGYGDAMTAQWNWISNTVLANARNP